MVLLSTPCHNCAVAARCSRGAMQRHGATGCCTAWHSTMAHTCGPLVFTATALVSETPPLMTLMPFATLPSLQKRKSAQGRLPGCYPLNLLRAVTGQVEGRGAPLRPPQELAEHARHYKYLDLPLTLFTFAKHSLPTDVVHTYRSSVPCYTHTKTLTLPLNLSNPVSS